MSNPLQAESEAEAESIEFEIGADEAGQRLDVAVAARLPQLSRSYTARLIKQGAILVDAQRAKPAHALRGGERITITLPEPEVIEARPENIPLNILYEDQHLIVVNKPAGMVSHPSSGHTSGALVNALLFHCRDLSSINGRLRPGIVHRLDKNTSGVMVAAKHDLAHRGLAEQFAGRTIGKIYVALCHGRPADKEFSSEGRIGHHPRRSNEMTVRLEGEGREARTDFEVLEYFPAHEMFHVRARPHTGRTHQIRVHLAKSGYPVLADELYGKESALPELHLFRHALHAQRLSFLHPILQEKLSFEAPLPDDILKALELLRGMTTGDGVS